MYKLGSFENCHRVFFTFILLCEFDFFFFSLVDFRNGDPLYKQKVILVKLDIRIVLTANFVTAYQKGLKKKKARKPLPKCPGQICPSNF